MTTVSINSSPSTENSFIRIQQGDLSITCPLIDANEAQNSITLATTKAVNEKDLYNFTVLLPKTTHPTSIELSINGSSPLNVRFKDPFTTEHEGKSFSAYTLLLEKPNDPPFNLTYGFARIMLSMQFENIDKSYFYTTYDIACLSNDPTQAPLIESMLDELLNSESEVISNWMFTGNQNKNQTYSILDGAYTQGASKSLSAVIQMLEEIAQVYKTNFSYFSNHSFCRVQKTKSKANPHSIKNISHSEVQWIAKNMDVLDETAHETNINYLGKYYSPRYIETEHRVKSYDTYENQVLIGFLKTVLQQAKFLYAFLSQDSSVTDNLNNELKSIDSNGAFLPAMVLVSQYATREAALTNRVKALADDFTRLFQMYTRTIPQVTPLLPPIIWRTKVFQEVKEYSVIYAIIQKWRAYGEFNLAREQLALHALRLDKLYEYYTLYRILDDLYGLGFTPDQSYVSPIEYAKYRLLSAFYTPEEQVASVYRLACGNTHVSLYYQPVIYGDEREDYEMSLHRLSQPYSRHDSYWTPDFVIRVQTDNQPFEWHILDAKYRRIDNLWKGYPTEGTFAQTLLKYRNDIGCLPENGQAKSVWLLSGRSTNTHLRIAESSSWAQQNFTDAKSGICSLIPGGDYFAAQLKTMIWPEEEPLYTPLAPIASAYEDFVSEKSKATELTTAFSSIEDTIPEPKPDPVAAIAEKEVSPVASTIEKPVLDTVASSDKTTAVEFVLNTEAATVETLAEAALETVADPEVTPKTTTEDKTAKQPQRKKAENDTKTETESRQKRKTKPKATPKKQVKVKPVSTNTKRSKELIAKLYDLAVEKEHLFKQRWASIEMNINHSLLRKTQPTGRDTAKYEPVVIDGNQYFAYTYLMPPEQRRLETYVARCERAKTEAETEANA